MFLPWLENLVGVYHGIGLVLGVMLAVLDALSPEPKEPWTPEGARAADERRRHEEACEAARERRYQQMRQNEDEYQSRWQKIHNQQNQVP